MHASTRGSHRADDGFRGGESWTKTAEANGTRRPRGPMTVSTGAGPAERNINEAVANRERNASQENAKAELQTSTTGSTRQASSPGTRTGSSDGDSGSGTRAEQRRAVQEP